MMNDKRIRKIVDYINAKDCFPQNSVSGGVNYFLWDRDHEGECGFTTNLGGKTTTMVRSLNEFDSFVRYNEAVEIIHKIVSKCKTDNLGFLSAEVTSRNPFGLPTSTRGAETQSPDDVLMVSSKGRSYVPRSSVEKGFELIDAYKVLISRITYEHAGEPDKEGKLRVLSKIEVLKPGEVCTDSYLICGKFSTEQEADNLAAYLKTKFARLLVSQTLSSINLNKDKFCFVPCVDFATPISEEKLYSQFALSDENVAFINSLIHSME